MLITQRVQASDNEEDEEVFPIKVTAMTQNWLYYIRLESDNSIRFQADTDATGAQCNVILERICTSKEHAGDCSLTQVSPSHSAITAYIGKSIPVTNIVRLKVWHRDHQGFQIGD